MVHSFVPVPFADAARQQLFAALQAALLAEPNGPATVLLGNLGAFTPMEADALLVRPSGAVLLVLTPQGGHLTMPALAYGAWQLDGLPLPNHANASNPFEQYQQQRPMSRAWLSQQTGGVFIDLQGIALFAGPLSFGPEVEHHLHQQAAAADFQLVGGVAQLLARLRAWEAAPATGLPESELLAWADQLAAELAARNDSTAYPSDNYLTQKLRQLWSWLGAEDIPSDPPYGGEPAHPTDQQERARLQQLRDELQTELSQQRQEAAAREATRTQELAQLRQLLAQAGLSATERRAEQQATATLEEELRIARQELTARNQELDARIQQLGLIIKQLQAPTPPAQVRPQPQLIPLSQPAPLAAPAQPRPAGQVLRSAPAKGPTFRRLRQAERWGVVALVLAGVGVGAWGVGRLVQQPKAHLATTAAHRRNPTFQAAEEAGPRLVYVVDSTLAVPAAADTSDAQLHSTGTEPAAATAPAASIPAPAQPPADSATGPAPAALTPAAAPDSATVPSPTP